MTTVRSEEDIHQEASLLAGQLREVVADQLHDLVLEREEMASLDELVPRIQQIGRVQRTVNEARGRQKQALELGLPRARDARVERENLELLRQAVLSLGATCGSIAVAMDFEGRKAQLEQ